MSLEHMTAFAVFAVVTSITPGPNNVMLTATGANVGIRRGLPHMLGVALGFALMLFLVAAGAGSVLTDSPEVMRVLRYGGVAMLLWLAWKIATAGRTEAAAGERPVGFFEAAVFQWANPKAWLFCTSAVGGFLEPGGAPPATQAALFSIITVTVGIPCMLVWLGFGAGMQRLLRTERALRSFNVAMGVLLAATALVLV
jgi:threonine/homoserine/homoserine lactone efflux protein